MKVVLNVAERVACMASLRSKKSDQMNVLLEYHDKVGVFALSDGEKAVVQWVEKTGVSATYKDENDGPEFRLDVELDLDDRTVEMVKDGIESLAKQNLLSASSDHFLTVYKKLTQPS